MLQFLFCRICGLKRGKARRIIYLTAVIQSEEFDMPCRVTPSFCLFTYAARLGRRIRMQPRAITKRMSPLGELPGL